MADYPISNVARRIVYTGSAGVGPYAFPFEVLTNTDINVYKNDTLLTLTTNYTVTISPTLGTGSITLVVAATGSDRITIVGARAVQRTTDFTTGGDFFANTLNDEMDSQTILTQQIAETAERSIKAPVTDPTSINMTLPKNTDRAGKYLGFDIDGNPVAIAGTGETPSVSTMAYQNANSVNITGGVITGITDLAIADGGTGASTASDARTNLGLGSVATESVVPIAKGGTNNGSLAVSPGGVLYTDGSKVVNSGTITSGHALLSGGTGSPTGVAPSTSGNLLTSNGTAWTSAAPPASGGMTLLGTIATTSGSSVSLTSLILTSYKQIQLVFNGVSSSSTSGNFRITDPDSTLLTLTAVSSTVNARICGICIIDLASGVLNFNVNNNVISTPQLPNTGNVTQFGITTFSTSSTSFTFSLSTGSFDLGSILVYGVR